jgi:hypothetical protein
MMMFKRVMGHWFDEKAVDTFAYLLGYFAMYTMIYIVLMWLSEHYKKEVLPHA